MSGQRSPIVYMLRLWQACTEDGSVWRAWLTNPHTGERCGFAAMEDLFDYLLARCRFMESDPGSASGQGAISGPSEEPD